jgi:hypothetical protein
MKSAFRRRTPELDGCALPMSQRLRALLDMRRHDPSGQVMGPEASCSAMQSGSPFNRSTWTGACRRAEIVGLTFHDLRREAGSRLLESGMPEHYVQRSLDHANLSTTSRYLKTTRRGMHEALSRVEERRNRCTAVAHEADSGLTLTEHPTGPRNAEVPVSKALPGQPLTN